jgi:hypothetical protein
VGRLEWFGRSRLNSCSLVIGELKKRHELTGGLFRCTTMKPLSSELHPMPDESHVTHLTPDLPMRQDSTSPNHSNRFPCNAEGCLSRPFKRRGDLIRHSRKHGLHQTHDCLAFHCNRTGQRGFTRKDKLVDHMLAGHDEDTLFTCPDCEKQLSRDLIAVHALYGTTLKLVQDYRTCPMPRCSFKVHCRDLEQKSMDKIHNHVLEKHDLKSRLNFTNLLEQRGYDARSCEVICPVCPSKCRFSDLTKFSNHFWQTHYVTDEVRRHRRTILRFWPTFKSYPVWTDIKCPATLAWKRL